MALVAPLADCYLCLSAMIYLYNRLKRNDNDLLIAGSHYIFLAQDSIIDQAPVEEEIAKATEDDNGKNESGKGKCVPGGATHTLTSTVSIA
ncbi:unnamed protein product [Adineta steineri]|uniref:Uncharacterized protein n=1 Tax=Adineta steineri TaxID=433720 RepID=A0A819BBP7_9BILA|nr:unnamed protein product [Adineta steineri]CAF3799330.1 unnamed protein product [Adineta steineri]